MAAAGLKLLSSMAPREALLAAAMQYRQGRGVAIEAEAAGGVDVARRVAAGEAVDIVVLSSEAIDKLIEDGHLSAASRVAVITSEIAVAVPSETPPPDLSNEASVKRAVAAAASISYSSGPSGRYLENLFERWGILEALRSRIVVPPPGTPVARLVANGQVRLGFQQLSELRGVAGIDVVGTLPKAIQHVTTFTAAITPRCARPDVAQDFLFFLASARLDSLKQHYGMAGAR
jgi:molybdate transport system substrate-binding protein